jgi:hypothetical protein
LLGDFAIVCVQWTIFDDYDLSYSACKRAQDKANQTSNRKKWIPFHLTSSKRWYGKGPDW